MPDKLIECVPNISEGRDPEKVQEVVLAVKSVPGVVVLDLESDPDHHRSVITFAARPEAALEAAFRCAQRAAQLIDLTRHAGAHPRMGATDVIPFIPLAGADLAECADLARRLGERIGRELEIPVFLYGKAATRPGREDLAAVRKGQFEGLRDAIGVDPERDPDFGPRRIHPSAGAIAVGARDQIINFNINLKSQDLGLARDIAKAVRASSGGLPFVRGKEIELKERGMVQVSTVLTDYKKTSVHAVFERARFLAAARGVEVFSTEIVGLVPQAALTAFGVESLKLERFEPYAQVLENRLSALLSSWEMSAARLGEAFASPTPTPGGGSASAVAGALASALGLMVVRISAAGVEKKREQIPDADQRLRDLAAFEAQLSALNATMKSCMAEDALAFEAVMAAYRLPKAAPERLGQIQSALVVACEVPLQTARTALSVLHRLAALERLALGTVASDLKVGRHLARAAIYGALENVKINLPSIRDPEYVKRAQAAVVETMKEICD